MIYWWLPLKGHVCNMFVSDRVYLITTVKKKIYVYVFKFLPPPPFPPYIYHSFAEYHHVTVSTTVLAVVIITSSRASFIATIPAAIKSSPHDWFTFLCIFYFNYQNMSMTLCFHTVSICLLFSHEYKKLVVYCILSLSTLPWLSLIDIRWYVVELV